MLGRRRLVIVLVALGVLVTVGCPSMTLNFHKNSDALWKIVSQQCVPGQE